MYLKLNKHISIFFICTCLPIGNIFANSQRPEINCSYAGKFNECYDANMAGDARSIEDFVCIDRSGNWQEVLTQIILDEKFREIDAEIEDYIERLEESKCEYFWPDASESFLRAVDDIEKNFPKYGYYWNQYRDLCQEGILAEVSGCTWGVVLPEAARYLWWEERSTCISLVDIKLEKIRKVSYDLLKINKVQCQQDQRQQYRQEERGKYGGLWDLMRDMIWYLERMLNGWVTKTRNPR